MLDIKYAIAAPATGKEPDRDSRPTKAISGLKRLYIVTITPANIIVTSFEQMKPEDKFCEGYIEKG